MKPVHIIAQIRGSRNEETRWTDGHSFPFRLLQTPGVDELFHLTVEFPPMISLGTRTSFRLEEEMNRIVTVAAAILGMVAAIACAMVQAQVDNKAVTGLTPNKVRWFTPTYYNDGRQRAQLFGDSSRGGVWIDRVKIPSGGRVLAHTHTQDELVTVIQGAWLLGEGAKFEEAKLRPYPSGSFIVIPAGVAHFVAAREGLVIVQLSGTGKFQTDYIEK